MGKLQPAYSLVVDKTGRGLAARLIFFAIFLPLNLSIGISGVHENCRMVDFNARKLLKRSVE